jgi:hypothetical protein
LKYNEVLSYLYKCFTSILQLVYNIDNLSDNEELYQCIFLYHNEQGEIELINYFKNLIYSSKIMPQEEKKVNLFQCNNNMIYVLLVKIKLLQKGSKHSFYPHVYDCF